MTQTLIVESKYYGAHGTLEGYASGLYVVEAVDSSTARTRLQDKTIRTGRGWYNGLEFQEIKGEWAKVLANTIDAIQRRFSEYYVDLGDGVYYVEV